MDHVVGKVQRDFIQREIGVLDLLGEHDIAVAIVARERGASVGTYGELPDLKFLGGDSLVVGLNDRDFIQKPVRPAMLGNMLRAVGIENIAIDPMGFPSRKAIRPNSPDALVTHWSSPKLFAMSCASSQSRFEAR